MKFTLVTLTGVKLDTDIYEAIIPTVDGIISVFPSHEPLVTIAKEGIVEVRYKPEDTDLEYFAISGGIIEISYDSIRILVDEADHGDEIIEAETRAALERAIKMRDEAGSQIEREKAKQLMDRHMVRLKVADLHRRKRRQR